MNCYFPRYRDCRNHLHQCKWEVFWAVLLVHNPLGITVTAICYHVAELLAQVIVYDMGGSQTTASVLAYLLLVAEMGVFYVADIGFVWQHTVYLLTPYITLIWLFIGAAAAPVEESSWEKGFAVFLLAVSMLAFVVKLAACVYRVHVRGYRYDVSCRQQTEVEMLPKVNLWFIPWRWRKLRRMRTQRSSINTFAHAENRRVHEVGQGRPFYIT